MKYPKYYVYEEMYKRYFLKGGNYLIDEASINGNIFSYRRAKIKSSF